MGTATATGMDIHMLIMNSTMDRNTGTVTMKAMDTNTEMRMDMSMDTRTTTITTTDMNMARNMDMSMEMSMDMSMEMSMDMSMVRVTNMVRLLAFPAYTTRR
eukprot:gnl/TRDRNA2_/TRDRNA2_145545_c0_seq1.p2 gnl/TRDRNA2_/TRDRNA2_145545_c0~~gnl/TRDRNA2_/TRDRNA2_145545_c0_seq1.p2  ORF type:complete len:117 (+),score=31.53 gnl/TRDRNA2_/TRDRNA2_145545_c0_seq1:46-351(+)